MPVSLEVYADTDYQRQVVPSAEGPNCGVRDSLEPLGYYSRGITSTGRDVLRILIRRFRCTTCFRTVSVLPSFAHPYRLVASATVSQFFSGTIAAVNARWVASAAHTMPSGTVVPPDGTRLRRVPGAAHLVLSR